MVKQECRTVEPSFANNAVLLAGVDTFYSIYARIGQPCVRSIYRPEQLAPACPKIRQSRRFELLSTGILMQHMTKSASICPHGRTDLRLLLRVGLVYGSYNM